MIVSSLIITGLNATAQPTVTVDPEKPEVKSTVKFTAVLDDDAISVWITVQECDANTGICFPDSIQNLSMVEQIDGSYEASATLTRGDATYIQYTLLVETASGWNEYLAKTKVNLAEKPNGDGNGNGDNGNGSPGFTVLIVVLAVIIIITVYYRKRQK
jgi:hypothetical protein